jgi:hypothetical protein
MNYTSCKNLNKVLSATLREGWTLERGGRGKHGKIIHPSGKYVSFSISPSDTYAFRNVEKDIKKLKQKIETEKANEATDPT